jgi:hypothetical protein
MCHLATRCVGVTALGSCWRKLDRLLASEAQDNRTVGLDRHAGWTRYILPQGPGCSEHHDCTAEGDEACRLQFSDLARYPPRPPRYDDERSEGALE